MPVPTAVHHKSNIWVAAGDGDLERVKELIENESLSPNIPDPYTYTPMHAAASYGHLDLLEYLVSKGGDVNIKDDDNETPLFAVESIEAARWLVEHGAIIDTINKEGNTPAQHLSEDFPSISTYLLSSLDSSYPPPPSTVPPLVSNYATEQTALQMTQSLLADAQAIMQSAETESRDPEAELREMVGRVVLDGIITGAGMAQDNLGGHDNNEQGHRPGERDEGQDSKRRKLDEG